MTQGQTPETRKPSSAMFELLLAAVNNNGYLFASLHSGRTRRTFLACQDRGWISGDGRITFTGRNAAHRYDADAYAAALPADHVDFELNRLASGRMPLPPIKDHFGGQAHVLAIPDPFIQYDVPPGRAGGFVGYSINTRQGLRTIMHVDYIRDRNDWVDGARIYLSDGKGGVKYAGTLYSEFQAYGPAGGPDLRQNSADLLDRTRRAHEQLTAAAKPAPEPVPHTNPRTERADTLVTSDDIDQLDETTAAETGARYAGAMAPALATWTPASPTAIRDMLTAALAQMNHRAGKSNVVGAVLAEETGTLLGTTGAGKTALTFYPEECEQVLNGTAGKTREMLLQLARASRDDRIHVIDPKAGAMSAPWMAQGFHRAHLAELTSMDPAPIEIAYNHGTPAGHGITRSLSPATLARIEETRHRLSASLVNPRTAARLTPAVDPGPLRGQVEHLRDVVVAIIGDMDGIAGDVTAAGYRLNLHLARISTTSERARDALMKLETALSEIERGATQIARVILTRATRRLARH